MDEVIELLLENTGNAAPYIRIGSKGEYRLVGNSDLANSRNVDYGVYGKNKLTALNHTRTLTVLMNYMLYIDELDENGQLDMENEDVLEALQVTFSYVLDEFFMKQGDLAETEIYPVETMLTFCKANPQLINEALYNLTMDHDEQEQVQQRQRSMINASDQLERQQFQDPYISIAFEIAKEFKRQPSEVIENWSTSELIVMFAKISNDKTLDSFLQHKYSDGKHKQSPPKKHAWFFDIYDDEVEDDG